MIRKFYGFHSLGFYDDGHASLTVFGENLENQAFMTFTSRDRLYLPKMGYRSPRIAQLSPRNGNLFRKAKAQISRATAS